MMEDIHENTIEKSKDENLDYMHQARRQSEFIVWDWAFPFIISILVEFYFADANLPYDK